MRVPGTGVERRKNKRLIKYIEGARRRIALRNQTLIELTFAYVVISVFISVFARHHRSILVGGIVIYTAFGYMIWTVLENTADTNEGNGFRLMTAPTRWRRNGVEFLSGLKVLVFSLLFSIFWVTFVMIAVLVCSAGFIRLDVIEVAHHQLPALHPGWTAVVLLPIIFIPIALMYRFLVRHARGAQAPLQRFRLGDRILWAAVLFPLIFFYMQAQSLFITLPFPLGQTCSSLLAILLTISTAALELSFRDENKRTAKEIGTQPSI